MNTNLHAVSDSPGVRLLVPRQPASVQGTLALELVPHTGPPQPPPQAPVTTPRAAPALGTRAAADVVLVHPRLRSDLNRWAVAFTQAVVEVIAGDRQVSQLLRWTTPDVHRELAHRAMVVGRAGAHRAGQGRARTAIDTRPQVASLHTSFITTAYVEICVVVRHGERSRFLAGRVQRVGDRWRCTELEFG